MWIVFNYSCDSEPAAFVVGDEVEYPADRVLREQRLLVQMHEPIVRVQKVVLVFEAVLQPG
jgi:hypothetical protein